MSSSSGYSFIFIDVKTSSDDPDDLLPYQICFEEGKMMVVGMRKEHTTALAGFT